MYDRITELTVKLPSTRSGRKASGKNSDSAENIEGTRKWLLIAVQLQCYLHSLFVGSTRRAYFIVIKNLRNFGSVRYSSAALTSGSQSLSTLNGNPEKCNLRIFKNFRVMPLFFFDLYTGTQESFEILKSFLLCNALILFRTEMNTNRGNVSAKDMNLKRP